MVADEMSEGNIIREVVPSRMDGWRLLERELAKDHARNFGKRVYWRRLPEVFQSNNPFIDHPNPFLVKPQWVALARWFYDEPPK